MNKDLTVGKPFRVLLQFCLPLFGSVIFQQLYNLADSVVAGKFIGDSALAAVGNSYEITLIFIAFAFGCNIGCSVVVSTLFGEKNYRDMKTAIYTTWISGGILCAVLMLLGLIFSDALLHLINTPLDVFDDSKLYLDIYIWGLPFVFFYNIATGIFSAMGDSRTPFWFLVFSSLSNIAVDILFVAVFHMGIAGVAWATFLCQGISCILAVLFVLLRIRKIPTQGTSEVFSFRILKSIALIAVPSILQQSSISVGNIIIQSIINSYGASVMAGYAAAIKLQNLVITSFTTLGNGISNYAGQNYGAGKPDRIRQGFPNGLILSGTLAVIVMILYLLAGKYLLLLFVEDSASSAISYGMEFIYIVAPFYLLSATKLISDGILRGLGKMAPFMLGTFADLILRVVFAFVFSSFWGTKGIWWAWPVGWLVGTVISLIAYFTMKLQPRIAVTQEEQMLKEEE